MTRDQQCHPSPVLNPNDGIAVKCDAKIYDISSLSSVVCRNGTYLSSLIAPSNTVMTIGSPKHPYLYLGHLHL